MDGVGNGEIRTLAAVMGVIRVVPGFRHHHRIVEIPTGSSQPAYIVDSQPLTTGWHVDPRGVFNDEDRR
jgi:hypothetical protein